MSNLERDPQQTEATGDCPEGPVFEVSPGRLVPLSPRRPRDRADGRPRDETIVNRLLPQRHRRMVGAWCFVDHYGPDDISETAGMQVAPHPHTGLQTVSWLVEGAVHHRDTIGSDALVRPGELGLMTAGRGIAHSERSPSDRPSVLHGLQLWVALPEAARHSAPAFEHHTDLPRWTSRGAVATVLLGRVGDAVSAATTFTPIVGAELITDAGADVALPLNPAYEHAIVVADGAVSTDDGDVKPGELAYLGTARDSLRFRSSDGARLLLLGGEPFEERIVMWWNFIGRSHDEIVDSANAWNTGAAFGSVVGDDGPPIPAPPMPGVALKSRGRTG
ncbi:MAG: pirin family protein [Nocardioidaceae bacterium]